MTIKLYENGVNRNNSCSISNWIAALLITLISTLSFSLFLSLSLSLSLSASSVLFTFIIL